MKTKLLLIFCITLFSVIAAEPANAANEKPNVLLILADDLGYSDLGCYGGDIETPNLDSLAENGLRFTQFYNTARCWPTRAVLMTGYYAQQVRRDVLPALSHGARGLRPSWAHLLPKMLKPQGYRSYHSGKWHIDRMPVESGFDHSYYLKDQSRFFNPNQHWLDDKPLPPVKKKSGYYGTISVADHVVKCLKDHHQNHSKKPFFHYLAFAAPHFPLHALPEDIAKYKNRYDKGWEKHRAARWAKQQKMGLVPGPISEVERDLGPPYPFPDSMKQLGPGEINLPSPWDDLTSKQKEFQSTKMAIHAAMIDRMDKEIGRVLNQLKSMGQFENTLIFFLSDNGASAEIMVRADGHDPKALMGSAETYLCLGPGWSTSSNTPFRRHKTWVHEGGISTPLIAHWPKGIQAKGELRKNAGHAIDIVPTILEVTKANQFEAERPKFAPVLPGKSLTPVFKKDNTITHDHFWWYHDGHRALRKGNWKIVAAKDKPWELYNLSGDRPESKNLAAEHPQKVKTMAKLWQSRLDEFNDLAQTEKPMEVKWKQRKKKPAKK